MEDKDKIIQYRFTAYLITSIEHFKYKYIAKKEKRANFETTVEDFQNYLGGCSDNYFPELDITSLHNPNLEKALSKIKELDIKILLLHVVHEYSLKQIAEMLDINYETVKKKYARTMQKIKKELEVE